MSRWLLTLAGIALVYAGLCLALYLMQRSMIYFPQPRSSPAGTSLATVEVDGRKVLATVLARDGPDAVIYLGGNAEDVAGSVSGLADAFADHALYLLHYPGYGGAPGRPSEAALAADALALYDRVATQHRRIVVIGRSLGSGVAVQVASARPVARLILVTPYDSLLEIAATRFPVFPVRWLLLDKFDSGQHAAKVTAPTLLIAAEHDEVIPRASTERLLRRFGAGVATLGVIGGADHNFPDRHPEYVRLLRAAR